VLLEIKLMDELYNFVKKLILMVPFGYKNYIILTLLYRDIKICFRRYKHIKSATDTV